MLTDNPVLVRNHKVMPALMCAQRKAKKKISTEEDFIQSNIESFGNEIGRTTNWITSMFEVRANPELGDRERRELDYRIMSGQHYQQNSIDKAKGIICKPMPRSWHDIHEAGRIEDPDRRELYKRIAAAKKPYFMRYIYPALAKQYNKYIKNTERNSMREFQMTVSELAALPRSELSERQKEFLYYYDRLMPVGMNDCVVNRICRKIENVFDGYIKQHNSSTDFDYRFMRSSAEYTPNQFRHIKSLIDDYNKKLISYSTFSEYERVDEFDSLQALSVINEDFLRRCDSICPDKAALCNIVLDICYTRSSTKRFAWSICASQIINNLLSINGNLISYPQLDDEGDIEYGGRRFSVKTKQTGVNE